MENKVKFLITIVDRNIGKKVAQILREEQALINFISVGKGSVDDAFLKYLGIGEKEKDVVFSIVPNELVPNIFNRLKEELHFDQAGRGVAFTLPVESISNDVILKILSGGKKNE